jgi:hypothetical protein
MSLAVARVARVSRPATSAGPTTDPVVLVLVFILVLGVYGLASILWTVARG